MRKSVAMLAMTTKVLGKISSSCIECTCITLSLPLSELGCLLVQINVSSHTEKESVVICLVSKVVRE